MVTEPDCVNGGYTTYTCSVCGDSYVADHTDALGHTEVVDKAVSATCTADGLTEGKHCSVCGTVLVAQQVIPAKGHSYDAVVTEPDCVNGGYTTYTCSVCGDSYVADHTDALGHTEVVDKAVSATCTADGLTEGKHCSVCGTVLVAQQVIPAKGHSYNAVVTKPDCVNGGYTTYTCSVCGDSYVADHTDALGHTEVVDKAVAATCTADGLTEGKHCSVCGTVLVAQQVIPAKGHSYNAVVTEPDCVNGGFTTYTCSVCGDSYVDDHTDALGHTEVVDKSVAATCTTTGLTEGKHCSVCGTVLVAQQVIPAKGHSYDAVVTEPTCAKDGYTTHTCSACGDSYVDGVTPATGEHTYDNDRDADCNVCGDIREVQAAKPGDANGDGRVNNRDLGLLQQYLNMWEVSVDTLAADLNGDGKVNNRDLGMLQKQLNA